jgi:hypothetical protein
MPDRTESPALTRRRFVTLVAAGSAALMASPLAAATGAATRTARPRKRGPAVAADDGPGTAEFERQRKSTLDTLAVIRRHAMPAGTEMALVFRPLKSARRSG